MILGRGGGAVLDLVLQQGMRRLGRVNMRLKVSALMDWGRIERVLHRCKLRSRFGRRGYLGPMMLVRCLLLSQCLDGRIKSLRIA